MAAPGGAGAGGRAVCAELRPAGAPPGAGAPQGGHLGAEDDQPVELVQEGALPAAALRVRLLHDQLRVDLAGQTEGREARRRRRGDAVCELAHT